MKECICHYQVEYKEGMGIGKCLKFVSSQRNPHKMTKRVAFFEISNIIVTIRNVTHPGRLKALIRMQVYFYKFQNVQGG